MLVFKETFCAFRCQLLKQVNMPPLQYIFNPDILHYLEVRSSTNLAR